MSLATKEEVTLKYRYPRFRYSPLLTSLTHLAYFPPTIYISSKPALTPASTTHLSNLAMSVPESKRIFS